ncbi:ATP synthase subunit I [Arenibacter sp. M-2]|uniref:ATP synthase subunit I n=1 Tax=Arenibacter sp. M-2 TaxID=3053612 RepID=UPI0025706179|nr:ATP synthase subunit I [Arenibacter sp. M-2]MDL5514608.1 ATP synthase subunit I [Arenibacter sp. M-2]
MKTSNKIKFVGTLLLFFFPILIVNGGFLGDLGKPFKSFAGSFMGDVAEFSGMGGFISGSFGPSIEEFHDGNEKNIKLLNSSLDERLKQFDEILGENIEQLDYIFSSSLELANIKIRENIDLLDEKTEKNIDNLDSGFTYNSVLLTSRIWSIAQAFIIGTGLVILLLFVFKIFFRFENKKTTKEKLIISSLYAGSFIVFVVLVILLASPSGFLRQSFNKEYTSLLDVYSKTYQDHYEAQDYRSAYLISNKLARLDKTEDKYGYYFHKSSLLRHILHNDNPSFAYNLDNYGLAGEVRLFLNKYELIAAEELDPDFYVILAKIYSQINANNKGDFIAYYLSTKAYRCSDKRTTDEQIKRFPFTLKPIAYSFIKKYENRRLPLSIEDSIIRDAFEDKYYDYGLLKPTKEDFVNDKIFYEIIGEYKPEIPSRLDYNIKNFEDISKLTTINHTNYLNILQSKPEDEESKVKYATNIVENWIELLTKYQNSDSIQLSIKNQLLVNDYYFSFSDSIILKNKIVNATLDEFKNDLAKKTDRIKINFQNSDNNQIQQDIDKLSLIRKYLLFQLIDEHKEIIYANNNSAFKKSQFWYFLQLESNRHKKLQSRFYKFEQLYEFIQQADHEGLSAENFNKFYEASELASILNIYDYEVFSKKELINAKNGYLSVHILDKLYNEKKEYLKRFPQEKLKFDNNKKIVLGNLLNQMNLIN